MKKINLKKILASLLMACMVFSLFAVVSSASSDLALKAESLLSLSECEGDKVVLGLSEGKTVADLIANFENNTEISVTKDGAVLDISDLVGTGAVISTETDSASVVILGDIDGDGEISSTDFIRIKSSLLTGTIPTGIDFLASNTQADDVIDATDYIRIKSYFLGTYDLYPETNNDTSEDTSEESSNGVGDKVNSAVNVNNLPEYSGEDYIVINNGIPYFTAEQLTTVGYEKYGELDSLGRCTAAIASLGIETMPTGDRGSISSIKPTGWIQAKYSCIKTSDLYNRSHLIAWSLSGEDANKQNLVTGTAHVNQEVMVQFEDMVRDYIKETNNHVAYRVTPLFKGNELVCRGIQMEAYSIEDDGEGICFNVYCFNVQDGVIIDYATGESRAEVEENSSEEETSSGEIIEAYYVLNKSSKRIHLPDCSSVASMSEKNKVYYIGSLDDLYAQGYKGCSNCMS